MFKKVEEFDIILIETIENLQAGVSSSNLDGNIYNVRISEKVKERVVDAEQLLRIKNITV